MYGGVEFFPLPEAVYEALCDNPKMVPWKDKGLENVALSTRIMSRQGCESIVPPGVRVRQEARAQDASRSSRSRTCSARPAAS